MAYIDQDRSREKTISGAISLAVIGVVGYGLVSGLAMSVIRDKPGVIIGRIWPTEVPPPPKDPTQPRQTHRTNHPTQTIPQPVPPQVPDTPLDTSHSDLGKVTGSDPGPTLPPLPPFPPQPPAADHSAGAVPKSAPGTWVTPDDYTPGAIRAGIEGRTAFRLDIGADGKPAGCTVLSSSGSDDLDRTACRKLMGRARFKAALDASGNPVASTYAGGVTWKLPAE